MGISKTNFAVWVIQIKWNKMTYRKITIYTHFFHFHEVNNLKSNHFHSLYQHFETDDPEYFTTKISYIENNDVDDMELTFAEEVYSAQGQLVKVRKFFAYSLSNKLCVSKYYQVF